MMAMLKHFDAGSFFFYPLLSVFIFLALVLKVFRNRFSCHGQIVAELAPSKLSNFNHSVKFVARDKKGVDRGSISLDAKHSCSRPVDQDLAQVDVAALADAEQLRFASSRILSWHESKPCCEFPALVEGSSVTDRNDDGCGDDRPDPWDLPYASAPRIGCGDPLQFKAEHFDLLLDCLPLTP
jgi:hypothetical protein